MRPLMAAITIALATGLGACDLPRDPETTLDRIEDSGTIRLGLVAGTALSAPAGRKLDRTVRERGAELQIERDEGEALLMELEEGGLDLVYGNFAASSPWRSRVHLGNVPGRSQQPPSDEPAPRFAFRNGENGWIMAMERQRP